MCDSSGVYICKSIVNHLRHGKYICKSEGIHQIKQVVPFFGAEIVNSSCFRFPVLYQELGETASVPVQDTVGLYRRHDRVIS